MVNHPEAQTALQPIEENALTGYPKESDIHDTLLTAPLFREKTLPDALLQFGIDNHRYRLLSRQNHGVHQLFFHVDIDGHKRWFHIASHSDKQALILLCHQLQRWLVQLNRDSEELYVVEPILLRTEATSASLSDYANRVILVLPGYTARFSNLRFREQVEQLIVENSPAHLLTQCLWLDFAMFNQFETLYTQWRQAKSNALQHKERQPECDATAQRLYLFCNAQVLGQTEWRANEPIPQNQSSQS